MNSGSVRQAMRERRGWSQRAPPPPDVPSNGIHQSAQSFQAGSIRMTPARWGASRASHDSQCPHAARHGRTHERCGRAGAGHGNNGVCISNARLTWLEACGKQPARSRPYKKNDNAHIERKNATDVRGLMGCPRYDTSGQCELLNCIYEVDDLHVSLWMPCRTLIRRVRDDERET